MGANPTGWRARVAVVLAALVPYLSALGDGFAFDDAGLILRSESVRAFDLPVLLGADYWAGFDDRHSGLYRPLTSLSFAVDYRLGGGTPVVFHATNLLLHAACALLALELFAGLVGRGAALAGALLFAVHPAHSEAVIAIAGRADLLSTLCLLAALERSLAARRREGRGWWWSAPLLATGMVCKEQAVVLPGLLLALDGFLGPGGRPRGRWREYGLQLLAIGAVLGLRCAVLGGWGQPEVDPLDNPLAAMTWPLRAVNALAVLGRYGALLAFPQPLSADYSFAAFPLAQELVAAQLVAALAVLAVAAATVRAFLRRPAPWSLGVLWAGLALAPVANLAVPIGTIMAERLLYLPSAGAALAAGAILAPGRRRVRTASGAVLLLLATLAWQRGGDWRDDETLFGSVLAAYPRSAKAHHGLGAALADRGQLDGAIAHYRRAIAIYPGYAVAHYNLGRVRLALGQYESARTGFAEAARLRPLDPHAVLNLGVALHSLGRLSEAAAAYRRSTQLAPRLAPAWQNLAEACHQLGEAEEASRAAGQLLSLQPDHPRRRIYEERMRGG